MSYKYTINHLSQRFTISSFSTFLVYIFSESISVKYHYIFSIYKVIDFIIRKSLCPLKETLCKYLLSIIWLTRHHLLLSQY
jgi:hypothetical protein